MNAHEIAQTADGTSQYFDANLAALRPFLDSDGIDLLMATAPSDRFTIVGGPTPTAIFDGRLVYSAREPARDAQRTIENDLADDTEACVFFNFGLGYHIEAFLQRFPGRKVVVVEPDLSAFVAALRSRDYRMLFSTESLRLVIAADPDVLPTLFDSLSGSRIGIVKIRGLENKDRDYFERAEVVVQSYAARSQINANTLARFGKRWVRNLFLNGELLAATPGVLRLAGLFDGLPALVLAAGPSLDLVLPHLKELSRRSVVIAVDTAVRAALDSGVSPDFLVVVDPQYWNFRHFDWCSTHPVYKRRPPIIISESSTYPAVFRRLKGPAYFCGSLFPLGAYLEARIGGKGTLGAGGSVATTTWDFARMAGFSPIFLAGLDLGFPALRTHFRGGYFEERVHALGGRRSPSESQAFHALHGASPFGAVNASGGVTLTDRRMVVYTWWFENQFKIHPEAATFSLAPEGVRIEGLPLASLESLLSMEDVRQRIDALLDGAQRASGSPARAIDSLRTALVELGTNLESLGREAREGIDLSRQVADRTAAGAPLGGLLADLAAVDAKILSEESRHVAGFLLESDGQAGGEEHSIPAEIVGSLTLYKKIAASADYHAGLVETTLRRLGISEDAKAR